MNRKEVTIAIENAVEDKPLGAYAFFGAFEDGTFTETTGVGAGVVTHEQMRAIIQKMRRWAAALGQQLDAATAQAMKQAKEVQPTPPATGTVDIDLGTCPIAEALWELFGRFEKHTQ